MILVKMKKVESSSGLVAPSLLLLPFFFSLTSNVSLGTRNIVTNGFKSIGQLGCKTFTLLFFIITHSLVSTSTSFKLAVEFGNRLVTVTAAKVTRSASNSTNFILQNASCAGKLIYKTFTFLFFLLIHREILTINLKQSKGIKMDTLQKDNTKVRVWLDTAHNDTFKGHVDDEDLAKYAPELYAKLGLRMDPGGVVELEVTGTYWTKFEGPDYWMSTVETLSLWHGEQEYQIKDYVDMDQLASDLDSRVDSTEYWERLQAQADAMRDSYEDR